MSIETVYNNFVAGGSINPVKNLIEAIERLSSKGNKVTLAIANCESPLAFTYEDNSGSLRVFIDGEFDFTPKLAS
ncbi:hypothetical protein ZPAH1_orf00002 [Aeromonas phage ZPAH1]|nr:hypothetical protein ZPAH1_orf00002 [Aeromonas phage ZPAH1]